MPPLNALRAFESAARHLSFTRAAEELNVTPGAISHQIKGLEELIGQPLFRRLPRALLLSDAGQRALPKLREGFDLLAEGAESMRAAAATGELIVSMSPSFAALWLVPRLDRFSARHPDIDIRIDATIALADFDRDEVDAAIRYGLGGYEGMAEVCLFSESVFPVCAPSIMAGPHPLRAPADLRHHTLLHIDWRGQPATWPNWRMWLTASGARAIDPDRGIKFSLATTAIQAAIDGQGVALAPDVLVEREIAAGRLVRPFDLTLEALDFSYYFICPSAKRDAPKIAAFRDWLIEEASAIAGAEA